MRFEDIKENDITYKIIGCAMNVHSNLGNGFQEVIYQRALAMEFQKIDLLFSREFEMPIMYDGEEIGTRRVDFLVEDTIMVELKALTSLDDSHLAQAINYLEAYNLEVGLLINFGSKSLQHKRVLNIKSEKSEKSAAKRPPWGVIRGSDN
jgi:GxxExxY protein